jgi:hypothetical protein
LGRKQNSSSSSTGDEELHNGDERACRSRNPMADDEQDEADEVDPDEGAASAAVGERRAPEVSRLIGCGVEAIRTRGGNRGGKSASKL